jgi:DNA-binding transcriptional ArsR family regulator
LNKNTMDCEKLTERECCSPKPTLNQRPLLDPDQAENLEGVFKDLANVNRLRLLHALIRKPGSCVTELTEALGCKTSAVSNHLRRLADRGIVSYKRNGKQICYRIIDPCIVGILDHGLCLSEDLAPNGRETAAA